ncbi:hypothetical protein JTE90_013770 [Oedothorax gibbosus]|uniref:Uncharacterized protein n=1 Tax=Oedothorax gibbosus TaxID=931172 RepID=A0AAV6UZW6_9ARAC|nr:hypothetical protein JTE90_013770 [Oedothorax gibbosus]
MAKYHSFAPYKTCNCIQIIPPWYPTTKTTSERGKTEKGRLTLEAPMMASSENVRHGTRDRLIYLETRSVGLELHLLQPSIVRCLLA